MPLEPRTASTIVKQIEQQITSGLLANGQPLPAERDLMAQFGASRTVIREAILTLSNQGLVKSKPRFRPIVSKPDYTTMMDTTNSVVKFLLSDKDGVKNLYDSRVFAEAGLVRQAALEATRDDIRDLRDALAANKDAIDDSEAFYKTDIGFHAVFYNIPKNPVFPALHQAYAAWLAPQWSKMERLPARNQQNYEAHKAIYDAILERDPDAAEAALKRHLDKAWQLVRSTFDI